MNRDTKIRVVEYILSIAVMLLSLAAVVTPLLFNFILKQTVSMGNYTISFSVAIVMAVVGIMMLPDKGD